MTYQRQARINEIIQKAVEEAIEHTGFYNSDYLEVLRRAKHAIASEVGPRITGDIGRARRLQQLCKMRKVK